MTKCSRQLIASLSNELNNKQASNLNGSYTEFGWSPNDKQLGRIARNPQFITDYNHMVSPTSPAGQSQQGWEFEMINRLKKDASQFKKRPIRDYLEY